MPGRPSFVSQSDIGPAKARPTTSAEDDDDPLLGSSAPTTTTGVGESGSCAADAKRCNNDNVPNSSSNKMRSRRSLDRRPLDT